LKQAIVNQKGYKRILGGHPWIFRSDMISTDAESADVTQVKTPEGRIAGTAFYSASSKIALRFFDRKHVQPDETYFRNKLDSAAALRDRLYKFSATAATPPRAVRIFFGESDGIPGLIVDRYGPVAVIQTLCPGAESIKGMVVSWCMSLPGIEGVVERNDPKVRLLEKLPIVTGILAGKIPENHFIEEEGLSLKVDVLKGQKTGAFLDQRDNREIAALLSHGRVLDAFCYQGWFSFRAARKAEEVISIDVSGDSIRHVAENAVLLGLNNIRPIEVNVFDYMRECDMRGERFDTIILDPPAFAKNSSAKDAAKRGYKEINLRAMKLLNPGGRLFTFSCSYHVNETDFSEIIHNAATDAKRRIFLEHRLSQSLDHPILIGFPESAYLKGLVLRID